LIFTIVLPSGKITQSALKNGIGYKKCQRHEILV